MKQVLLLFIVFLFSNVALSQNSLFKATLSNDTIYQNNFAIVGFKIVNNTGEFVAPDFSDFVILKEPKINSYSCVVNGKQIVETNYIYYVKPTKTGDLVIKSAYLNSNGMRLKTNTLKLHVLPKFKDIASEERKNKRMLRFSVSNEKLKQVYNEESLIE